MLACQKEDSTDKTLQQTSISDEALFNAFLKERGYKADNPERVKVLKKQLSDLQLLTAEAKKRGIESAEFDARMKVVKLTRLSNALLEQVVEASPITDVEIQKEYDTQKGLSGAEEYHLHHVLVKTRKEADNLEIELANGTSFEQIETDFSQVQTNSKIGDLGWVRQSQLPPELAKYVKTMNVGDVTQHAVKSKYGFHILFLEAKRDQSFPELKDVKEAIRKSLKAKKAESFVKKLRDQQKTPVKVVVGN